ncbi:MAG TPA: bifunctional phosphopantothenoylcysteine decarboxylase/phosphopantothenate--cysteine ligase CoaBC [Acidimicrobiales bacterium]|nr:bifunctional phosphopantothenoylcysteine decarboxylase/phosphopantothenate--cysteine ligase CoaBC [Acidimicrobiales bacterium]
MRDARIVLGVTGGIAAYKAVEVCRRLVDAGAHVVPVMTRGATRFVGEVTLSALASEPVKTSLWDDTDPIPHTRLGQSADLVVVAPATARLIGSYAAGISDGLLVATLLATEAPVLICPAMHTEMWNHPAVQENLATLARRGVHVLPPEEGRLAGGDSGSGRLASPEAIVDAAHRILSGKGADFAGLKVLVTAGGTREAIDTVRVISNRSSGKQGYAVAAEAAARGAEVTLVTTVDRPAPPGVVEVIEVASAADMQDAVMGRSRDQDVIVMAAAVADFRPKAPADHKLKKRDGPPEIVLEPTHDFLVDLGSGKPVGQTLVGFAAETDDVLANARTKLADKRLDLIVANDVGAPGVGFEHDTNEVHLVTSADARLVPLANKRAIARAILDQVLETRSNQA